jgi:AcrR family transcriptional regulator
MAPNAGLSAIRKAQIIEAALQTISVRGCHNVTMDEIARAADLSKGGVAHYFPSKDVLLKEAFRDFFDQIFQRAREVMDSAGDPLEKLLAFGWLFDWKDPDLELAYPLMFDMMSLASRDAAYREIFSEWINNWIELLSEALEQGNREGKFQVSDCEATARTISAIYQGLATRWFLDRASHSTGWARKSFDIAIRRLLQGSL